MGRPRKRFGQHWLRDEQVLHEILAAANIEKRDRILEIGPGQGVLTKWLVSLAEAVVAVEIDWDLHRALKNQFEKAENFYLIQGDILELDVDDALLSQPEFQHPNKVVANIPYYITGPILEKLLGTIRHPNPRPYDSIVLLLQKEVAERLYAAPGSKTYGALSVRVQYLADCELICPVPAKAFKPPPKVDSAVIRLRPRPFPIPCQNPKLLDQLVKLGFAQKRKMLRNNLKSLIDRDRLNALLEAMALNPQARAEDLSVPSWITLSNQLSNIL
ncbi:MAG: 16S rRNA (adenine(1518)-N(6)/adenine(1519)-N(6))-dimethyltransferase RsmA [Leptolyngbya sp. SIO4C1]|nr:16S rRNA (adenine(1518)-N(6)/adenine(1519)-N(6))-dimethyltransferase RsmA [Leptolyngbya sp. SIO4C1]